MAIKYSKQRSAIIEYLQGRVDHPTADMIYSALRIEHPNLSMGTVYRNLNMLAEMGEIKRLDLGDGTDHFDPNTSPHMHFLCKCCGRVTDIHSDYMDIFVDEVSKNVDGQIMGSVSYFYGNCADCLTKIEEKGGAVI